MRTMSYLYDWHSLTSSYQEVIINPDQELIRIFWGGSGFYLKWRNQCPDIPI
ncbi:hypothetical protein RO3G_00258 [Rhizopus delemar RA 99-880]|uniref:Uncharacterized protein n=1 Tax=Rhizopus delemar (strain RA 99-880 / ATCC MYA-4621 / FGSC 9543 / NRRL 43880) TaxID=246409 RepID=I1BH74_RHIO9|nr:hypothetical protein RO3G_00258 [Rhizopus delemar RA 99-880]|eukprot:EIE75554.1 hypothetical protein RO3G_00258 [Rhizopus delemar RA 99-880]